MKREKARRSSVGEILDLSAVRTMSTLFFKVDPTLVPDDLGGKRSRPATSFTSEKVQKDVCTKFAVLEELSIVSIWTMRSHLD